MAKKIYIGIPTNFTVTNMIGIVGDFELGDFKVTSAEGSYLYSSSNHKFGTQSLLFSQANSSPELTYTLRNSNGQMSFPLNNTHTYYFSIWINQATSLNISFDMYWPIAEPSIMSGVKNTALNQWQQHSIVFTRSGFSNGNYPIRIDCNNYPGNSAQMRVDGMMLIDLTATFGAGNEPDKEWCDSNIQFTTSSTSVKKGVAREVSKLYVGVNGIARKITKGYVGVGGIARLFFSGQNLAYYGAISNLSVGRSYLASSSIQNYLLFGGGSSGGGRSSVVDVYNTSLNNIGVNDSLSQARNYLTGGSLNNNALFAGGQYVQNYASAYSNIIEGYSSSLTKLSTIDPLSVGRSNILNANVGGYTIFAGGLASSSGNQNISDCYNSSLTKTTISNLARSGYPGFSGTLPSYAAFGGLNSLDVVDLYNSSLTFQEVGNLNMNRVDPGVVVLDNNMIVAGGTLNGVERNYVYALNNSLTSTSITSLSRAKSGMLCSSLGTYGIFTGGFSGESFYQTVEVYDSSLTKITDPTFTISVNRDNGAAGNLNNQFAIFVGGNYGNQYYNTAEAFTI